MGDRANVYVAGFRGEPGIFLYAHWGGAYICGQVQDALKRGGSSASYGSRWDDAPYLTRIIFESMIDHDRMGTTSLGISTSINDNDGYPILVVDTAKQAVWLGTETVPPEPTGKSWSFSEFMSLPLTEDGWPEGARDAGYAD